MYTPIGPLSFVISQNLSKADTDQTQSFNFQIGTSFKNEIYKNLFDSYC